MDHVLQTLGLSPQDNLDEANGLNVGRVVIAHGERADVLWMDEAGRERSSQCDFETNLNLTPVAGDWVALRDERIAQVLPRRSELRRPHPNGRDVQILAANIDLILIVLSSTLELNRRLLERLSIMANESGAATLLVVTKIDDASDLKSFERDVRLTSPDADVLMTSSADGEGIETLRGRLVQGVTAVMLGASGAGKTSLLNALEGSEEFTRHVDKSGEGRHATTTRKLYRLSSGGVLLDIPGIRLLDVMVDDEGLALMFPDIDELLTQCRFRNCQHNGDEGCAVDVAVASGSLTPERVEQWREVRREIALRERLRDPSTAAARHGREKPTKRTRER
jgi:ribosome biogenesis GTPase